MRIRLLSRKGDTDFIEFMRSDHVPNDNNHFTGISNLLHGELVCGAIYMHRASAAIKHIHFESALWQKIVADDDKCWRTGNYSNG